MASSEVTKNGPSTFLNGMSTETLLVCGICHSHLYKPKILPCLHTFCKKCLKTLIPDDSEKTLECPTCLEVIAVPKNKEEGFKDNLFLMQLQGLSGLANAKPKPCDICEEESHKADRRCMDCEELMCKTCAKAHRRMKATKKHKVLKLSEIKKKGLTEIQTQILQCEKDQEPVTLFCMKCDSPACDKCLFDQHKNHRTLEFPQAAAEKRLVLQVTMTALCQKATELHSLLSNVEGIKTRLETHKKIQLTGIEEKRRELIFAVQRIGDFFKDSVDTKMNESLTNITNHFNNCQVQLRTFQTIIELGNKLMEHGTPRDVVLIEKDFMGRLNALDKRLKSLQNHSIEEDLEESKVTFLPGICGDVELKNFYGDLTSQSNTVKPTESEDALEDIIKLEEEVEEKRKKSVHVTITRTNLHKAKEPWIPYFQQDMTIYPTTSPLTQDRQRDQLCMRLINKALNKLSPKNFSTQIVHILDSQMDTELKLEKFCYKIIGLVAGGKPALVPMFALLCRSLSFLSVATDGRPGSRSTIMNFLDRLCMKRFETDAGIFLSTGMTPQISRSQSFSGDLPEPGPRRPSVTLGFGNMHTWGPRTPQAPRVSITDIFQRNRSAFGSFGRTKKRAPPPPLYTQTSRTASLKRTSSTSSAGSSSQTEGKQEETGEMYNPFEEIDRRRSNLCIILFVCEMYKLKMVAENIVYEWMQRLTRVDNDLAIEAICAILINVGKYLDHERSKNNMNKVFVQLTYVSGRKNTRGRTRAMIQDLIQLRGNNWETSKQLAYWRNLLV